MKKNILLPGLLVFFGWFVLNVRLAAGINFPENPYTPEYILAHESTQLTKIHENKSFDLFLSESGINNRSFLLSSTDTIPLNDRTEDFINSPSQNPFDLRDPAIITQSVEYDPETGQYIITERIGDDYFRPPTYMTFEEFMEYQARKQEQDYFNDLSGLSGTRSSTGRLDPIAKVDIKNQLIDRLFGGTEVDIRPQGNIDLTFGVELSNVQNPSFTQRQQRQGGFDFDMGIQMNVEGSIGKKLKLSTNYNTQATFDFDNTMKLNYNTDAFGEDDIIKKIEAGNVSLPLRGTLIQGSQSLFGLKMETQWGRLRLTGIASQQKSEQEEITLKGGSQFQEFVVPVDEYDENRHFFLTHYNREHFEEALSELPVIKTLFKIQNIQVWVTDTRNATENIRDIVAIADLGETRRTTNTTAEMQPPAVPVYTDNKGEALPDNRANPIYSKLLEDPRTKQVDRVVNVLKAAPFNMQQGRDFEKVTARMLSPTEFTFHPELGFVSLNVNIQPDQVVGVAFSYTYLGEQYQVGQIAQSVPQNSDTTTQNVLFVKMLKGTIQPVDIPTWDLMMKNIYNIGAYNVAREDFKLDIFYEDPGEGKKRFLPETNIAGIPLLRIFNLDRLNVQNDPVPDGVFDFVEGVTINSRNGRIMFPKLEPFGRALASRFTNPADSAKFVYSQLYKETLFNAREFAEFNRFTIEGSYKSSVASEISLGAFNIPQGSVRVSAGGQILQEGRDYEVDYNIGRVRILNDAILNAGVPVKVSFEDNTLFGFQTKTMLGLRADYEVNKNLTIGGTYLRLFERPFTQKVNIGDDPINNRIFGLDMNYSNQAPWLTKLVDKLPFYSTKEMSNITFAAETAAIKPGHARAINEDTADDRDKGGVVYLDDFEGSVSSIDLRTPFIGTNGWVISSIPQNDEQNNNPLFPESSLRNDLNAGVNRALINWYRLDPSFRGSGANANPYTLAINQQEIFPNFTPQQQFGDTYAQILDVSYDPTRRGPYNFDLPTGTTFSKGIDAGGFLRAPETRWGGIMRQLTTNDFQSANIEFIEFWLMSPYLDTTGAIGGNPDAIGGDMDGYLYINLGNVSEDIMPDSRKFFENGLPGPNTQGRRATETAWGRVPLTQQITNAFDIDPENRRAQDVGLDGLPDDDEREKFADYLAAVQSAVAPAVYQEIENDPSNDNFRHYRDYPDPTPTLQRYSRFFGTEGNTPENTGQQFVTSSTQLPDAEDLDGDRTLNETESYFQYRIPIKYDGDRGIDRNNPFITEAVVSEDDRRVWYRFRVPLNLLETDENFKRVGGIRDFRSIRFMRMYMTGFKKPVNLRFATLELVRNQWRRYRQDLGDACFAVDPSDSDQTLFEVNAVNIEENSRRTPFGYVLPPGISREQALGVNLNALQNEQSLSLRACDLEDGDARAIFKNVNLDMRYFSKLKMFVHGEETDCGNGIQPLEDGDLTVFIRLGSDFKNNFYEYEIPLKISKDFTVPYNATEYPRVVWPFENDFNIDFELLKKMKIERNKSDFPLGEIYEATFSSPDNPAARLRIKGNPNLGLVKAVMIGVRNPKVGTDCDPADKKSVEIWVNELRVFGLDERGGVAATARLDLQLADLGTVTLSGKTSSIGFGALDQQLAERSREQIIQYDIATQIQLDKFLPSKLGLRIPFYFQYSNETRNPQFDPYDLDIELKDKIRESDPADRDSIRQIAQYVTSIKSYNFTNVRKERTNQSRKPMPWDISNFSFTYAFDETQRRDPIIENDAITRRRGAIDYNYSRTVKYIEPFKNVIKNDKYLKLIKELNFNPFPNSFGFSTDLDRRFNSTKYRFAGDNPLYNTFYNKQFLWNRSYDLQWDLTKNLKFQFNADNRSIIDEPDEARMLERNQLPSTDPDYISDIGQYRRDSIWSNIRNFGRTKGYQHGYNITYTLPLKNLPYFDWTSIKASWKADYSWDAASQSPNAINLGNIIRNGQNRQINGDFDFEKLYNYSPYLKKINSKPRPGAGSRDSGAPQGRGGRDAGSGKGGGGDTKDAGGALDTGGTSGKDTRSRKERKADEKAARQQPDNNDQRNRAGGRNDVDQPGGNDLGGKGGTGRAGAGSRDQKKKGDREPGKLERSIIRPLMVVRKLRLTYSEDYGTVVPGYLPDSKLFGMDALTAPGWDFVAGLQPNMNPDDYYTSKDWLYSNWTWITSDMEFALPRVTQNYQQNMEARLTLEPFTDFRIDVEAKRSKTENHTEEFRRTEVLVDENQFFQEEWRHTALRDFGSFTVTYSALRTLFNDDLTGLFKQFDSNRVVVANRLSAPPGSHQNPDDSKEGYPAGYGRFQQNVLLPAFIAAYTGQDANTMKVSTNYIGDVVLKTLPRPNWRLTYNGLSKLPMFQDLFQSFSISHGYRGTLTVNNFYTTDGFKPDSLFRLQDVSLNYFSRLEVPDIQIEEQFSPLIGVDMRLKNDMSFKFEYKTARTLRLELLSNRLQETKGTDLTVGFGYKIKNLQLGFLTPKKKGRSRNKPDEQQQQQLGRPGANRGQNQAGDFDITFDFSLRDDITTIHELVTDLEEPSRGNRTVSILPQATYQLNRQLSLRLFFDYRRNVPKTSQGYPTTNIRSGVTVRFSLN